MAKYGAEQFGFQNSATPIAEGIVDLHDYIMFYIIIVFVSVSRVYFDIPFQNLEVFNFQDLSEIIINEEFLGSDSALRRVYFLLNRINHATNLEIIRTLPPSLVLITIAVPSLPLLYSMDELLYPKLTLKVIGLQWYWMYEYSDTFINNCMVLGNSQALSNAGFKAIFRDMAAKFASLQCADLIIESYMVPDSELNNIFEHRLPSTDNFILLPIDLHIRVLVTGSDVLHSRAVPSLGIKIDAVPGRLNQVALYLKRQGIFYGQCSESCGVNHGFMPIVLKSVSYFQSLGWVSSNMSWRYANPVLY
jgi:cytochrome c oxidase subunit 2